MSSERLKEKENIVKTLHVYQTRIKLLMAD